MTATTPLTHEQTSRSPRFSGVCECEDITHFDDGAPERLEQRYQAHVYGVTGQVEFKTTDFGTFVVCAECVTRGHMGVES